MTGVIDLDEVRGDLRLATGQQVTGEGIGARLNEARFAGYRLAGILPALLDELEQLRGKTAPPTLAERQARYLEVRQHTLSTADLPFDDAVADQAEYVADEARELQAAAADLIASRLGTIVAVNNEPLTGSQVAVAVRHELADVVLATVTLANILGVTVEGCIAEKTEHDRGRG